MQDVARLRIGDMLVGAKVISEAQLESALAEPRAAGQRIGDVLLHLGLVNETQLTQTLSQQLSVPWVSLYHIDFSRQLLDLVPRDVADGYCLVPVFVRKARKRGDTLYVAMDDPTNEAALEAVSQFAGLPARPMIASRSDIRNAIRVYYPSDELEAPKAPETSDAVPKGDAATETVQAAEGVDDPEAGVESGPVSEAPDSLDSPGAAPALEAREVALPLPKSGSKRAMVALTLLDGTTIQLPSRKRASPPDSSTPKPPEAHDGGLTARDLISALRAVSHGADATEILGEEAKWQAMFAALLSLMLRKGLIADWEFVDEYRKI